MKDETAQDEVGGKEPRYSRAAFFRDRCAWLPESAHVPQELAEEVVAAAGWWLSQGSDHNQVQAPRLARKLTLGIRGWEVPLGSNRFAVETFIRRARPLLRAAFNKLDAEEPLDYARLRRQLEAVCATCVMNYRGEMYARYPQRDEMLVFGTLAIHAPSAAQHLIDASELTTCLRPSRHARNSPYRSLASSKGANSASVVDGRVSKRKGKRRKKKPAEVQQEPPPVGSRAARKQFVDAHLRRLGRKYPATKRPRMRTFLADALERSYAFRINSAPSEKEIQEHNLLLNTVEMCLEGALSLADVEAFMPKPATTPRRTSRKKRNRPKKRRQRSDPS